LADGQLEVLVAALFQSVTVGAFLLKPIDPCEEAIATGLTNAANDDDPVNEIVLVSA
jgi:hypothetical protein